jgi:NAD(P)-dependent dehydrogenase (short-subunit alcohol dehydrogenase family)
VRDLLGEARLADARLARDENELRGAAVDLVEPGAEVGQLARRRVTEETSMDLGLAGATVVIGGGSRGMGLAAARCFAADGARVAVLARTHSTLEDAVTALRAAGSPDALGIPTDLSRREEVEAAFAEVGARWGALNVLVNAAGPTGAGVGPFERLDDEAWQATFDVGVLSMVRAVRAALPWLRKAAWARIVNLSAHSTKRQAVGLAAYTASKAAMTSVSKNLSLALAPEGILVNTVSPGSFLSEALRRYLGSLPAERGVDPGSLVDAMRVIGEAFGHPAQMGRAGDPAEIGPVIAFLASRVNSYMTGANVNVDGGSDWA